MNEKQHEAIYETLLSEYGRCKLSDCQTFMLELFLSPADREHRIEALMRAGALLQEAVDILSDDRCGVTLNSLCSDLEEHETMDKIMLLCATLRLRSKERPCSSASPSEDHAGSA